MTIDVLNLEWNSSPSRDRESASLVCNYLRLQGYKVEEKSIFNAIYEIKKYKPKVIFISNSSGARINLDVVKYAKSKGINVLTSTAEGNFRKEYVEEFFWGVNKDQVLYEDITCLWSHRSKEMIDKSYPEVSEKVFLSGGVGFDRYKICDNETDKDYFRKLKEKYDAIVCVSCWSFDFLLEDTPKIISKELNKDELDFFKKDRNKFQKELKEIIDSNKNVFFVLKEHPGRKYGRFSSGIDEIENAPNIRIVKDEMAISTIIMSSDIVLSYESTTALEAWLCGKQTALLNPSGENFGYEREDYYRGQPNYKSAQEWNSNLKSFILSGGILPGFSEYEEIRNEIISNVIGYDDGLNHVRAGNYIISLLSKNNETNKMNFSKKYLYSSAIKYFYFYLVSRFGCEISSRNEKYVWNDQVCQSFSQKRMLQQENYYLSKNYSMEFLKSIV